MNAALTRLIGKLRTPGVAHQRRRIAAERTRLEELRDTSAALIRAKVARIADLEGEFLAGIQRRHGTTSRAIAASAERAAKAAISTRAPQ